MFLSGNLYKTRHTGVHTASDWPTSALLKTKIVLKLYNESKIRTGVIFMLQFLLFFFNLLYTTNRASWIWNIGILFVGFSFRHSHFWYILVYIPIYLGIYWYIFGIYIWYIFLVYLGIYTNISWYIFGIYLYVTIFVVCFNLLYTTNRASWTWNTGILFVGLLFRHSHFWCIRVPLRLK